MISLFLKSTCIKYFHSYNDNASLFNMELTLLDASLRYNVCKTFLLNQGFKIQLDLFSFLPFFNK